MARGERTGGEVPDALAVSAAAAAADAEARTVARDTTTTKAAELSCHITRCSQEK
jgi:hypothetical protein